MLNILKKNRKYHIYCILIFCIASLFFFLEIYAIKRIVAMAEGKVEISGTNIALILLIYMISYILYYFKFILIGFTENLNKKELTIKYFMQYFKNSINVFESSKLSKEANVMVSKNFDIINKNYYGPIYNLIYDFTFMLVGIVYLFYFNKTVGIVSVILFLLPLIATHYFSKLNDRLQILQINSLMNLINKSKDIYDSSLSIIVYNSVSYTLKHLEKYFLEYTNVTKKMNIIKNICSDTINLLSKLREYIVLFIIYRMFSTIKVDTIFIVIYLSMNISIPLVNLGSYFNSIRACKSLRKKIVDLLSDSDVEKGNGLTNNIVVKNIKLRNIAKEINDKVIFKDFSYTFCENGKYLICGDSGKGKSTLINLILGLRKPTSGSVFINDIELNNEEALYGNYSYISQSEKLFNLSIKQNIVLFDENEDLEKYKRILKELKIELDDETIVNFDNANLSGGEIQKILIARAMYHEHKLIILDEAFSSLDNKSSYELEKMILSLKNIMLINVSHYFNTENLHLYDDIMKI